MAPAVGERRACRPRGSAVTTAGRPVGIAETENATAVRNSSSNGCVRATGRCRSRRQQGDARDDEDLVGQRVSCRVSGVISSVVDCSIPLMWPTSVVMPVAGHDDRAGAAGDLGVHERHVDAVAERGIRRDGVDLLGHRQRSRRSAPIRRSRASRRGQEPAVGRDEVAGLDVDDVARDEVAPSGSRASSPSRRTLALTTIIFWRAATLASALPSWLRPMRGVEQGQADQHDAGRRTGPGGTG